MSRGWNWKSGDWWILCDSCQKKIKASESRKRWDGLIVCADDWEYRHPQDFIKAQKDRISVPFSRPQPTDTFVPFNYTSYPSETLYLDEVLGKVIVKTVPNVVVTGGSTLDESLGMQYLAEAPLGGSGTSGGYTNELYLSETVTVSLGRTLSPTDTVTLTEAVVVTHIFNQSLASQALATITLG